MSKYFIAVYTNKVKDYCDEEFFKRVGEIRKNNYVGIIDNTIGTDYFKRLTKITKGMNIYKVDIPVEPKKTQFHRNVTESVKSLRQDFLDRDEDYFLIIESDIIPPADLLDKLDRDIELLEARIFWQPQVKGDVSEIKPWGIIGGLYYKGFHDYEKTGLQQTHHALSGCTVYKRELIEKYDFRYDPNDLAPFPDALICFDSGREYSIWNDHDIKCEHLHAKNGTRYSHAL